MQTLDKRAAGTGLQPTLLRGTQADEASLLEAARQGHREHGAKPDVRNLDNKTPLDLAREQGNSELVALLTLP